MPGIAAHIGFLFWNNLCCFPEEECTQLAHGRQDKISHGMNASEASYFTIAKLVCTRQSSIAHLEFCVQAIPGKAFLRTTETAKHCANFTAGEIKVEIMLEILLAAESDSGCLTASTRTAKCISTCDRRAKRKAGYVLKNIGQTLNKK
jgi:hypothetical protein